MKKKHDVFGTEDTATRVRIRIAVCADLTLFSQPGRILRRNDGYARRSFIRSHTYTLTHADAAGAGGGRRVMQIPAFITSWSEARQNLRSLRVPN